MTAVRFIKPCAAALVISINLLVLQWYGVACLEIVWFVLAVLVATLIPGLLVLNSLNLYTETWYRFILALAVGICLDILLYVILSIGQVKFLLIPVFLLLLLIYLVKWGKRDWLCLGNLYCRADYGLVLILGFLSVAVLLIIILFYFIPNPLPGAQAAVYHVDYPWHLGNIAEVKNHWYPEDSRLAGNYFHYHVFIYVYLALLSYLTGLDLPVVFFRLYIPLFHYLLLAGAYFCASRWYGSQRAGIWHVVIVMFLGTALLSWPYNVALRNLFISPTYLLALVLTVFFLTEMKSCLQWEGWRALLVVLLLVFGISGAKGSFYPVILAGLLLGFIYMVLTRRWNNRLVILLILSLAVFLGVFVYIYQGIGSEGINILPGEIITATDLWKYYQENLEWSREPWGIVILIGSYVLLFFSFRLPAFVNQVGSIWRRRNFIPVEDMVLVGMILGSLIPAYLLSYRGTSQYYYLLAGFTALNLISAGYLQQIFHERKISFLKIVLVILLVLSTADTLATAGYQQYVNTKFAGIRNQPLTPEVYQALTYIKDNTATDILLASYRSFWLNEDDSRFFYYSAFSQRRVLVEGWQYMSPQYQEEALKRYQDMKTLFSTRDCYRARAIINSYGLDYILVDKKHGQRLRFKQKNLVEKVFENKEMAIYRTQVVDKRL
ncbi:hypothetical protein [Syntrophomonas erecta]